MKKFLDVFPTLELDNKLKELLREVEVTKVATASLTNSLNIYIKSNHLIFKKNIARLKKEIKKQVIPHFDVEEVIIKEEYDLSVQYTPKNLLDEYTDSLIFQLEEESQLSGQCLKKAEIVFVTDDAIKITVEDNFVSRSKIDTIKELLIVTVKDICKVDLKVEVVFVVSEKNFEKRNEKIIEQHTNKIMRDSSYFNKNTEVIEKVEDASIKAKESKEKKSFYTPPIKKSKDPDVIYGMDFEDECIELKEVIGEMGEITFRGQIISMDIREIRNEKSIVMCDITDFTDTIRFKMFLRNDQLSSVTDEMKKGKFFKIKGVTGFDTFEKETAILSVKGIKKTSDFRSKRMDTAEMKRVELHCHTKMSDMDAVSDGTALIKCAHSWGHKALAITDHGVVQGYTGPKYALKDIQKEDKVNGKEPFKMIMGLEAYLVDDLEEIAVNATTESLDDAYVIFDIETTGFSAIKDKIIEIGAVKLVKGEIVDRYSTFVNPKIPIPFKIQELTGINDSMVIDAPEIQAVLPEFLEFIGDAVLVAHNASFDVGFIQQNCRYQELSDKFVYLDTVALSRVLLPQLGRYKLNQVAKALKINLLNHHRAVDDAEATAQIFLKFIEMLKDREIYDLKGINQFGTMNPNAIRKMPTYHAIILVKNLTGRRNMYKLVSESHIKYYNMRPRIPKSLFNQHREGLILGSACEAGELYQAILREKSQEVIAELCDYYDYYEIQPRGNNQFLIESDKVANVNSVHDLEKINKKIVGLGEKFNKPVVATCDVHFINPEDAIYRTMITANKYKDAENQPPIYLHTTDEMLEEFSYLGSEKAFEVVVKNTNMIADMIDNIPAVRPDKCPPVLENSDQELRDICYDTAHKFYGEDIPKLVIDRLERELTSIISNGYSVLYIISQKIVDDSVAHGYLVGSRGSVGSSFVATMARITEVNPLPPHYRCEKCFYSDFESEEVKSYAGSCGWDMPEKKCPQCGEDLMRDGFDIPFETFLGFKGDKEPDIDLNFSGEYQAAAHKYTEELFGEGYTFKAGTIGTVADKTAFGYVKKFYDERGITKRGCEINRIAQGCTNVRRNTGQHPGGIIVMPHGEDINSFIPIQRAANKVDSDIITTHFDYHSFDHNLLKLDILGHDDPTIIRVMEDLIEEMTGEKFDATRIPLDDQGVMDLFAGTEILGIKPEDISGTKVGCLGVPEFGTEFVIQMVIDAKPKSISDLIRISGLSHGTDVWLNNAQTLIQEGLATISTAICTRDDIMTYLINIGMDSSLSFNIMEMVRRGKGLTPEWEEAMLEAGVPEWYIGSCKKIKYMFPKAHAAAYVMMAYRIAYCKVNYPLAYYAAYFGIRAKAFNYGTMCLGKSKLDYILKDLLNRTEKLSKTEEDTVRDMRLVQEMYARGYEFAPIDIYKSKARYFQIQDGKLLPPLSSIDGMGEKVPLAVESAAKDGPFLSRDDFRQRTKATQTTIDHMVELGLFGDLPASSQYSLFDL